MDGEFVWWSTRAASGAHRAPALPLAEGADETRGEPLTPGCLANCSTDPWCQLLLSCVCPTLRFILVLQKLSCTQQNTQRKLGEVCFHTTSRLARPPQLHQLTSNAL